MAAAFGYPCRGNAAVGLDDNFQLDRAFFAFVLRHRRIRRVGQADIAAIDNAATACAAALFVAVAFSAFAAAANLAAGAVTRDFAVRVGSAAAAGNAVGRAVGAGCAAGALRSAVGVAAGGVGRSILAGLGLLGRFGLRFGLRLGLRLGFGFGFRLRLGLGLGFFRWLFPFFRLP